MARQPATRFSLTWLLFGLAGFGYLFSHFFRLTALPVFADESIYIRWAQLIIDEPSRYLFFALNDGKTPAFIWGLVPWLQLFSDPLWAARWWAVAGGAVQLILTAYLVKLVGGRKLAVGLSLVWTTILPFWFFHHRMALMDGWLTVWLTATLIALIHLAKAKPWSVTWISAVGVAWGLALWTKVPAILWAPSLALTPLLLTTGAWLKPTRVKLFGACALAGLVGGLVFVSLRISPAFGQLFSRGSDFLYPWQTIAQGGWRQTIPNWPTYFGYFVSYLTWPVLLLAIGGIFARKNRQYQVWLWLIALGFAGPIALMGRVVYPRYFLPVALPLTVSAILTLQEWSDRWLTSANSLVAKALAASLLVGLLAQSIVLSSHFMFAAWFSPNRTPFVAADRVQYLTEWSSGHGIIEAVNLIKIQASTQPLAVASEGFFGTLPDGLLLYLHGQAIPGLKLEGIGQPITAIPTSFWTTAAGSQQVLLVANSHRIELDLSQAKRLLQVCRPYQAPCLEVWDITALRPADFASP